MFQCTFQYHFFHFCLELFIMTVKAVSFNVVYFSGLE